MAAPMSDEELYQLTGSWEAAAALRDEQARGATQNTQTAAANVAAPSGNFTLDDLKSLYKQKGATEQRTTQSGDAGDVIDYIPIQYGNGWSAFENDNRKIIDYIGSGMDATPVYDDAPKTLGGFSKQEGDYVYNYDTEGNFLGRTKWNESSLKTLIRDLGPIAMGALTFGGGAGLLGNSLFGLQGTAASAAGGALAGGINAYGNDQDILKGALLGGVSGAGSAKLGDILGADTLGSTFKNATVGDVTKALNFAQNPTLAGAANLASPYVTTNFDIGDTGFTTNDILKSLNTAQALGSGDNKKIFDAITGLAKGTDFNGLTANEMAERDAIREEKRLNNIILKQPASDDGSTQGIVDLINEMYPAANVMGMSEGQLAKFLEANMDEIKGSADLETLLKGAGQKTADEGTVTVTGDRPTGLGDFMVPVTNTSKVIPADTPEELVITGDRPTPYISNLRTKDIVSDIKDDEVKIDKLFPDLNINDILQTVTPDGTKTVVPTKTTTPGTTTTQQALTNLGLNAPMPSQDPYANIKLMEELFGGDVAYKLRSLGAPKNLASADIDALARLLRG